MSRMQTQSGFVLNHKHYKAGQTFADSVANALAGDVVWTGMSSAAWSPSFVPLDAGATALKNGSRFALVQPPTIDGVNSTDA